MPVDLGETRSDTYGDKNPVDVTGRSTGETVYPKFCYRGPKDLDFPECGTMVISFQKVREEYLADEDGEHYHYECEILVKQVLAVKEEKDIRPSKRDMSTENALDALAEAKGNGDKDDDEGDDY